MVNSDQSNRDVQKFFTDCSENRFEDELLSSFNNFYLDDEDDDLINEAYDSYLISLGNYLSNEHNYANRVS